MGLGSLEGKAFQPVYSVSLGQTLSTFFWLILLSTWLSAWNGTLAQGLLAEHFIRLPIHALTAPPRTPRTHL